MKPDPVADAIRFYLLLTATALIFGLELLGVLVEALLFGAQ